MDYEQSTETETQNKPPASEEAFVKEWTERITSARMKVKDDFKRMRENMRFAGGRQWVAQVVNDDRYVINLVQRQVNNKVAQLYARNPKVRASRRQHLDFQVWDGKIETLQHAVQLLATPGADPNNPSTLMAQALLADYTQGRQQRDVLDKICRTLEILAKWQWDNQLPDFKTQMKALVRRVITCGVGYVGIDFSRAEGDNIEEALTPAALQTRLKVAKEMMARLDAGEIQADDAAMEKLKTLFSTIEKSTQTGLDDAVKERMVYNFPSATNIIVDPACTGLKGFIGAHWIAEQSMRTVEQIEQFFGIEMKGVDTSAYEPAIQAIYNKGESTDGQNPRKRKLCLWHVYDLDTKSMFYIAHGWKRFIKEPEPVFPDICSFWPIFALTFNDVETEETDDGEERPLSIYPQSDVDLLKSPQKEWNRSREGWRNQRRANEPKYVTGAGWLTEVDKANIVNSAPNSVIEITGTPPGADVTKLITPLGKAPIDPQVYDTGPLQQDMFLVLGNEQGPEPAATSGRATATAATINEQSRVTTASSNVDDLNDLLSSLAKATGEILIKECSEETVKLIVGPGAVWPSTEQAEMVNHVLLDIVGNSNGRPNKALDTANLQMLAPTIMALAAGNPKVLQWFLEESIRRLDDQAEVDEIIGLVPPTPMMAQQPPMGPQKAVPTPTGQMSTQTQGMPTVSPQGVTRIQPQTF